jgi:hypothetical protein
MKRFFITVELDMKFDSQDDAWQKAWEIARLSGAEDYSVDVEESEDDE